jgi:hypothetical protein
MNSKVVDYSLEPEETRWNEELVDDSPESSAGLWLVALLLAGVLCLITGSVLAGAIAPVLSAVAPSFRAAKWIRQNDSDANRATACFRYQIATGCWTAFWSSIAAFLIIGLASEFAGHSPSTSQIGAAVLTMAAAAFATSLIGLWAFGTTLKNGVRVWAHPKLLRLAAYNFSKLSTLVVPPATCNHAIYVTATSLALPAMALGTAWMIYSATTAPPDQVDVIAFAGGMLLLVGWPVLSIGALALLSHRLFADSPADCWSNVSDETKQ